MTALRLPVRPSSVRNTGATDISHFGNTPAAAPDLHKKAMTERRRPPPAHADEVRRLRDLLRAGLLAGRYTDALLPGEGDLMAGYQASRSVVREALQLLRAEGLVERTQGIGTTSQARVSDALMTEAHGGNVDSGRRAVLEEMRPRVLARSMVPMPPEAAAAFGTEPGEPCLRLEYVSLLNDEPIGLAANYVRQPQADRIRTTPFVRDWYRLLADAGVTSFESRFIIGGALADDLVAAHLDIPPGSPVMTLEQLIHDANGRPFDLAFVANRTNRFRLVSWSTLESTHVTASGRPHAPWSPQ